MGMRKNYTSEFKAKAVLEILREAKSISEISGEIEVHSNILGRWKNEAVTKLHTIFDDCKRKEDAERKAQYEISQELYAQIGELTTKLNWLKKKSGIDI
jgi:transposase